MLPLEILVSGVLILSTAVVCYYMGYKAGKGELEGPNFSGEVIRFNEETNLQEELDAEENEEI